MDIDSLKKYLYDKTEVSIPQLQSDMHIGYREASEAIESLQEARLICYDSGVMYKVFRREEPQQDDSAASKDDARTRPIRDFYNSSNSVDPAPDSIYYEALKFSAENGYAEGFSIIRKFNLSFLKTYNIIKWMEEKGYVEKGDGFSKRKMLIGKEEVDKILQTDDSVGDKDDNDVIDAEVFVDDEDDEVEDIDSYLESLEEQLAELENDDDDDDDDEESSKNIPYGPIDIAKLNPGKDICGTKDTDADFLVTKMRNLLSWDREEHGGILVRAQGLKYKTGEEVKFRLSRPHTSLWILSDNTFTKHVLTKVHQLSCEDADKKLKQTEKVTRVVFACDELRLATNPADVVADLIYLYNLVQSLI